MPLRHAVGEDIPAIVALANRVFRPTGDGDMGAEYPLLLGADNAPNVCLAQQDGRIVSVVGAMHFDLLCEDEPLGATLIGSVCTDPECRGGGLAGQAMVMATDDARARGDAILLISGGRSLYTRNNALPFGATATFVVPSDGWPRGSAPSVARPFTPADLPAIHRLYSRQPTRFNVDETTFSRLFQVMCGAKKGRGWVLPGAGGIDAWAIVLPGGIPRFTEPGQARLWAWAGAPEKLLAVCAASAAKSGDSLVVRAPFHERDLVERLAGLTDRYSFKALPDTTILIIDLPRLVGLFARRVAPLKPVATADTLQLTVGGQTVTLRDRRAIHHVLLTRPDCWPHDIPSMPRQMAGAIGRCLPIPIPDYGVCYV